MHLTMHNTRYKMMLQALHNATAVVFPKRSLASGERLGASSGVSAKARLDVRKRTNGRPRAEIPSRLTAASQRPFVLLDSFRSICVHYVGDIHLAVQLKSDKF